MKRSGIQPGAKSIERGSTFGTRKPPRRVPAGTPPLVQQMQRAWGPLARRSPCAMCGASSDIEGHHVISLEALKRERVHPRFWFDPRNCLSLCSEPAPNRCHDRHELHVVRVPRQVVLEHAPRALDFADQIGLRWLFDREYPDTGRQAA